MQSFLSVLVIVGALFVFAGNRADGTPKKVYYLIAASLWMLAAFLTYIFYFGFTVPDTIRAGVVVELFGLEFARLVVDTSSPELVAGSELSNGKLRNHLIDVSKNPRA
jgi:energy-coupling factor transporter transmembrane protein EcfT